jgi:3-deoxy-D-manno-octulosonic-acid transferase
MKLLYLFSVKFYVFAVHVASLFSPKARLWISGRRNWKKKLSEGIVAGEKYIWVHCASLGEFEQGRPVIEAMRKQHHDLKIVLTFFSPSGYEIRKNYPGADYICYLPSDGPYNARFFADAVKPVMAVFVKYEFWYYLIREMHRREIPVYLVSGIFRREQVFFRWYGKWYRNILTLFTHLFVQDEASLTLLGRAGIKNVTVAGDTRFDRVWNIYNNRKDIESVKEFAKGAFTLVCGSTWPADEEILLKWLHEAPGNVKYIIAPHEIHESRITGLISRITLPCVRYSMAAGSDMKKARVLVIDNIGMLSSLYGYGKVAYVGGGFGKGIHNVAEAAVYGMPVLFGPRYKKFGEAVGLEKAGAAFPVSSFLEFEAVINTLLNNNEVLSGSSHKAGEYIRKRTGATECFLQKAEFIP